MEIVAGPGVALYYPRDGGFGIYCPISFLNRSERGGAIVKVTLLLGRADTAERYYIEWIDFSTRDAETQNYRYGPDAQAITIPARSAESKLVRFVWRPDSRPEFHLTAGRYAFDLAVWTDVTANPQFISRHSFEVSDSLAETLDQFRERGYPTTRFVTLDNAIPENKLLGNKELEVLAAH